MKITGTCLRLNKKRSVMNSPFKRDVVREYSDALFYSDIRQHEQNAVQRISKETNIIPAQAGIPVNKYWFWKTDFPSIPVKSSKIRLFIEEGEPEVAIAEFCVYNEKNQ